MMLKLKMTCQDKVSYMSDIESCTERVTLGTDKIDYAIGDSSVNDYRYFDAMMNGENKIVAVAGDVEVIEIPDNETVIETYNKKVKM